MEKDQFFDNEAFCWLNESELGYSIWDRKYRRKHESFEDWLQRVSGGNEKIKQLIKDQKFLFGGRTLANRNYGHGSLSNCYSSGFVLDHMDDIMDVNKKIAMTFKAEGGQGLSLSKIRPKGALIGGEFPSAGIIPFMKMFNMTTDSIMQGSSRRGALMMSCDVWHKDIEDFITIKSREGEIEKANLSVEIDNTFMQYVKDGVKAVMVQREYDGNWVEYEVNPVKLFTLICEQARKHAEPGILFVDRLRNYNIMECCDNYSIETTNPCGEQPLHKDASCNLSSINLYKYVINPFTSDARLDAQLFKDIPYMVKAMDDIIEENLPRHPYESQREAAKKFRNIGIGFMGIADMLAALGLTYGSADSIQFMALLTKDVFRCAVRASVELAKEKGSFPGYDSKVWDSEIIHNAFHHDEIEELKKSDCLRNCSLLSIAPTGSIGTMIGVSGGIEPFFAVTFKRKTLINNNEEVWYDVAIPSLAEYQRINNTEEVPEFFIESHQIDWNQRILMQAAVQNYIDTAISSTINLPKGTTQETVEGLYMKAWEAGLKGVTIYVDGSRPPVLTKDIPTMSQPATPKRQKSLEADYYNVSAKGERFHVFVGKQDGKPFELFALPCEGKKVPDHTGTITKQKSPDGQNEYVYDSEYLHFDNIALGEDAHQYKNITMHVSFALRHNCPIREIIHVESKCDSNLVSFNKAVARVLSKYIPAEETGEKCPECGGTLVRENGCVHCSNPECNWSRCE